MFKKLEEANAVVVERGVYKEADVYEGPMGGVFLKTKGGFVRLYENGSTSHSSVKLEIIHTDLALYQGSFGRVTLLSKNSKGKTHKLLGVAPDGSKLLPLAKTGG